MLCFFFQAEDGIRDLYVTGVQTCALPIWNRRRATPGRCRPRRGPRGGRTASRRRAGRPTAAGAGGGGRVVAAGRGRRRSEERRVGKECRAGWAPCPSTKNASKGRGDQERG